MLELRNVSFEVNDENDQNKKIIHDLSLKVDDQKFVVITGPNGGGKSTLARLIAGIEKPTSGQILMDGIDITEKSITDAIFDYLKSLEGEGALYSKEETMEYLKTL